MKNFPLLPHTLLKNPLIYLVLFCLLFIKSSAQFNSDKFASLRIGRSSSNLQKFIEMSSKTLGFFIGQRYMVEKAISVNPSIKSKAKSLLFIIEQKYSPEIENIKSILGDSLVSLINSKVDETLSKNIIEPLSEDEVLKELSNRLNGGIDKGILEFLHFMNPRFQEYPAEEFTRQLTYTFSSKGHAKSKDLDISFKLPVSWHSLEGDRPNVIQKFVPKAGLGSEVLVVVIKQIEGIGQISSDDLRIMERDGSLEKMIAGNYVLEKIELQTIETYPTAKMTYRTSSERAGVKVAIRSITYCLFIKDKIVFLNFGIYDGDRNLTRIEDSFSKMALVMNLIANSVIVNDRWR